MGNSPSNDTTDLHKRWHSTQSEFSFSSTYSGLSVASSQRPWSRKSRRRFHHATLARTLGYSESKTPWPAPFVETLFLPEFPIKGKASESDFEILHQLAHGAFGSVLKVRHKSSDILYAMKVLSKSRVIMENAMQQCKDEVTIQSILGHHTFIVKCDYYWQNRKQLFIVTRFIEGGELLKLWQDYGNFSEDFVRALAAEIAIALDFLHNAGVIYRDLKMENILLDAEGHVQLIDFGLSKWLSIGTRANTICGTIQYMAPEILNMDPYGHPVDWWSLGIIMYTLLTGNYPVQSGNDHNQMRDLVTKASYQLPEHFSNEVRLVVRKLLCKLPQKRLQNLYNFKFEPFFRNLKFDHILERKISPRELLLQQKKVAYQSELVTDENELIVKDCGINGLVETFEGFSCNSIDEAAEPTT